jgi:hypothetical protein
MDIHILNHYEPIGWEYTKPGWYEVRLQNRNNEEEIFKWVRDNIGKCERHCRWNFTETEIFYKFRYERDYIFFTLKWS